MKTNKCKLCKTGDLPGINSHILSEFIIKETVNVSGKANSTVKDNEFLISLSPNNIDVYIGRHATEGYLKYVNKEELTEDEANRLKLKENSLKDKNFVCYKCEKLFQPVENAFKWIYENKFIHSIDNLDVNKFQLSEEEKNWFVLFLHMNIWRCSASEKNLWRIDKDSHECLTSLMEATFIDSNSDTVLEKFMEARKKFNCLKLTCFVASISSKLSEDPNQNFVVFDITTKNPYAIVANRLIIFISTNNFDYAAPPKRYEDIIEKRDFLRAITDFDKGIIPVVNQDRIEKLNENFLEIILSEVTEDAWKYYVFSCKEGFGKNPPESNYHRIEKIAIEILGSAINSKIELIDIKCQIYERVNKELKSFLSNY